MVTHQVAARRGNEGADFFYELEGREQDRTGPVAPRRFWPKGEQLVGNLSQSADGERWSGDVFAQPLQGGAVAGRYGRGRVQAKPP